MARRVLRRVLMNIPPEENGRWACIRCRRTNAVFIRGEGLPTRDKERQWVEQAGMCLQHGNAYMGKWNLTLNVEVVYERKTTKS